LKNGLTVALLSFAVAVAACDKTTGQPRDGMADTAADARDVAAADGSSAADAGVDRVSALADGPATDALDAQVMGDANDALSRDGAETDGGSSDGGSSDGGDGGSSDGGDGGATCGPTVLREMLCTTYCQGIGTLCTGANAQYPSADECRALCNAPAWECGNQGDTTGNSLFCRLAHLALAGVGSAVMECPDAGPASLACR
jgi:hypothetical protein